MNLIVAMLLSGIILLTSCSLKKAGGSIQQDKELGRPYYILAEDKFRINLFGDYNFHPVKKFINPFYKKQYLPLLSSKINAKTPFLMYAAHTTVAPYYSTIALYYKQAEMDTSILNFTKNKLIENFSAEDVRSETAFRTGKPYSLLTYKIIDPVTRIRMHYREYFTKVDTGLLRISFWSRDENEEMINGETERIIREISTSTE